MAVKRICGPFGSANNASTVTIAIETDEDLTLDDCGAVVCVDAAADGAGPVEITLPPNVAETAEVTVVADGGDALVLGGEHPLTGGPVLIKKGFACTFLLACSGAWVSACCCPASTGAAGEGPTGAQGREGPPGPPGIGIEQIQFNKLREPASVTAGADWTDLVVRTIEVTSVAPPSSGLITRLHSSATFSSRNDTAGATNRFRLVTVLPDATVLVGQGCGTTIVNGFGEVESGSLQERDILTVIGSPPGTYTVKLQWKTDEGTASIDPGPLGTPSETDHADLVAEIFTTPAGI